MRLGFDLDGTLADMQTALSRQARELFPTVDPATLPRSTPPNDVAADETAGPPEDAPSPNLALTPRQQRQLWRAVCDRQNFWESLDEIEPGALARLSRLAHERRWEIIFLTSRPETRGDTAQAQSHRWLIAHGFSAPSVFVVHGSRGKIAAALQLDVVVDDRPENCLDVAIDSSARAILVWRGDATQVPASARQLGIGAVSSIAECVDLLQSVDNDSDSGTGIVDRLKRLLGLRGQSAPRRASVAAAPAVRDVS